MENIEIGECVRTTDGIIGKVIKALNNRVFLDNLGYAISIKDIVKHSKYLIDLIEVGDIVEIFDVLNKDILYIWSEETLKALKENIENGIQIRTILTKELHEANCYKVGGEDE